VGRWCGLRSGSTGVGSGVGALACALAYAKMATDTKQKNNKSNSNSEQHNKATQQRCTTTKHLNILTCPLLPLRTQATWGHHHCCTQPPQPPPLLPRRQTRTQYRGNSLPVRAYLLCSQSGRPHPNPNTRRAANKKQQANKKTRRAFGPCRRSPPRGHRWRSRGSGAGEAPSLNGAEGAHRWRSQGSAEQPSCEHEARQRLHIPPYPILKTSLLMY
jgi:hypothetical protein